MFSNYFKIALRNLIRQKTFSLINISGLAIGLACFIIVFLFVNDELSFDRFHEKIDDLYRVNFVIVGPDSEMDVALTHAPLAKALKNDFPVVENTSFYQPSYISKLKVDDKYFDDGVTFVSPSFLEMFTFDLIKGDKHTALSDPRSIVLSKEMADKYFGKTDPLDKIIIVQDSLALRVTGVIDFPKNTSMRPNSLVPVDLYNSIPEVDIDQWSTVNFTTLVQLKAGADPAQFNKLLDGYIQKQQGEESENYLYLSPFADIYLYSDTQYDLHFIQSDISRVYILSVIAVMVLLVACINFMNLSTARVEKRMREVGLRKVIGARRKQLIFQFIGESLMLSFIALAIGLVLVSFFMPIFNEITGKTFSPEMMLNISIYPVLIIVTLITGLIAGSYPAFVLSSYTPAKVLRASGRGATREGALRKGLVVLQFSASIVLIISTIVINEQLDFIQNKDLGYNKNNLLHFSMTDNLRKKYPVLKNLLLNIQNIKSVTSTINLPLWSGPASDISEWEGRNNDKSFIMFHESVDYDYIKTFGMKLAAGRDFSRDYPSDKTESLLINETAAKEMGMTDPLGKRIKMFGHEGRIIGVVKDYHFNKIHFKIGPRVMKLAPENAIRVIMRVSPGAGQSIKNDVLAAIKQIDMDYNRDIRFMTTSLDMNYKDEKNYSAVSGIFTLMIIFVACLGLFGLASFIAERRTREIGIRKVLGATVSGLIWMLIREFGKWVLLANIVAIPLGYYFSSDWLGQFAYHTEITIWLLIIPGLAALLIAIITVGAQALKAALTNPVKAIRYE